eukprot:TRINITY_DN3690_c0_g1_i1.p1 TRINITY_DN3690_c0_g1~~TRINITY_DN3690_c0_g1_i1.p1  ORF type:complete len:1467 (+),score=284.63 TRINITY_DN3690_c0_g1_i1:109-4509(+)
MPREDAARQSSKRAAQRKSLLEDVQKLVEEIGAAPADSEKKTAPDRSNESETGEGRASTPRRRSKSERDASRGDAEEDLLPRGSDTSMHFPTKGDGLSSWKDIHRVQTHRSSAASDAIQLHPVSSHRSGVQSEASLSGASADEEAHQDALPATTPRGKLPARGAISQKNAAAVSSAASGQEEEFQERLPTPRPRGKPSTKAGAPRKQPATETEQELREASPPLPQHRRRRRDKGDEISPAERDRSRPGSPSSGAQQMRPAKGKMQQHRSQRRGAERQGASSPSPGSSPLSSPHYSSASAGRLESPEAFDEDEDPRAAANGYLAAQLLRRRVPPGENAGYADVSREAFYERLSRPARQHEKDEVSASRMLARREARENAQLVRAAKRFWEEDGRGMQEAAPPLRSPRSQKSPRSAHKRKEKTDRPEGANCADAIGTASQSDETAKRQKQEQAERQQHSDVAAFRRFLANRCGSSVRAWRWLLDPDVRGYTTLAQLASVCRNLGYTTNVRSLWRALGGEKGERITLRQFDGDAFALLLQFRAEILNYWHSVEQLDDRILATPEDAARRLLRCLDIDNAGHIQRNDFVCLLSVLGLTCSRESARLFDMLTVEGSHVLTWYDLQWLLGALPSSSTGAAGPYAAAAAVPAKIAEELVDGGETAAAASDDSPSAVPPSSEMAHLRGLKSIPARAHVDAPGVRVLVVSASELPGTQLRGGESPSRRFYVTVDVVQQAMRQRVLKSTVGKEDDSATVQWDNNTSAEIRSSLEVEASLDFAVYEVAPPHPDTLVAEASLDVAAALAPEGFEGELPLRAQVAALCDCDVTVIRALDLPEALCEASSVLSVSCEVADDPTRNFRTKVALGQNPFWNEEGKLTVSRSQSTLQLRLCGSKEVCHGSGLLFLGDVIQKLMDEPQQEPEGLSVDVPLDGDADGAILKVNIEVHPPKGQRARLRVAATATQAMPRLKRVWHDGPSVFARLSEKGSAVRHADGEEVSRRLGAQTVKVHLEGAIGLEQIWIASTTVSGAQCDCFCICQIAGKPQHRFVTDICEGTWAPTWDHHGTLEGFEVSDSLEFQIYNEDKDAHEIQLLAHASLPSRRLLEEEQGGRIEVPIEGSSGPSTTRKGTLHVSLEIQVRPDQSAAWRRAVETWLRAAAISDRLHREGEERKQRQRQADELAKRREDAGKAINYDRMLELAQPVDRSRPEEQASPAVQRDVDMHRLDKLYHDSERCQRRREERQKLHEQHARMALQALKFNLSEESSKRSSKMATRHRWRVLAKQLKTLAVYLPARSDDIEEEFGIARPFARIRRNYEVAMNMIWKKQAAAIRVGAQAVDELLGEMHMEEPQHMQQVGRAMGTLSLPVRPGDTWGPSEKQQQQQQQPAAEARTPRAPAAGCCAIRSSCAVGLLWIHSGAARPSIKVWSKGHWAAHRPCCRYSCVGCPSAQTTGHVLRAGTSNRGASARARWDWFRV